jgi:hypothetical protein
MNQRDRAGTGIPFRYSRPISPPVRSGRMVSTLRKKLTKTNSSSKARTACVSPGSARKCAAALEHDYVERLIRHAVLADLLPRLEHPADDAAVLVDQKRLRIGRGVVEFEVGEQT